MLTLVAGSEQDQEVVGARLAAALHDGCVIYLQGELGAGKTTLVRGLLRGLGHRGAVKSPTYTLLEPYFVHGRPVLHLDLYRLVDPAELEYIGLRDLVEPNAVWLVEWPEHGRDGLPAADLRVEISYRGQGRRLGFTAQSPAGEAILAGISGDHSLDPRRVSRKVI